MNPIVKWAIAFLFTFFLRQEGERKAEWPAQWMLKVVVNRYLQTMLIIRCWHVRKESRSKVFSMWQWEENQKKKKYMKKYNNHSNNSSRSSSRKTRENCAHNFNPVSGNASPKTEQK